MIQINDMFRAVQTTDKHWNTALWHLEQWEPASRIEGRWTRITNRMDTKSMDRLLERMDCPERALNQFREAM